MWFTTITIRIRSWNWIGISSLVVCRQSKYILIFLLPDDDFIRCDLSQLYSQLLLIRHCNVFYIRFLHVYFFRETFPKLKSFSQKLMFASNSNRKYIMVAGCFMHMPVYVCVCIFVKFILSCKVSMHNDIWSNCLQRKTKLFLYNGKKM